MDARAKKTKNLAGCTAPKWATDEAIWTAPARRTAYKKTAVLISFAISVFSRANERASRKPGHSDSQESLNAPRREAPANGPRASDAERVVAASTERPGPQGIAAV